jgi:CheY-like chemotaxis protein
MDGGSPVILVVDDSDPTANSLVRALAIVGRRAAYVTSGQAALDFIQCYPVSLVILDWMMPGMSGLQVLQAIRAQPRFDQLGVVIFSTACDAKAFEQAKRAGADDYLIKGRPLSELLAVVERFTGKLD